MTKHKLRRIFKACLPTAGNLAFFMKSTIVFLIIGTFTYFILYAGTARADSNGNILGALPSSAKYIESQVNGEVSLLDVQDTSALAKAIGFDYSNSVVLNIKKTSSVNEPLAYDNYFVSVDYGATGRLINASAMTYETEVASPRQVVQYYAEKVTGKTYAASPLSGSEVLFPVFFLSNFSRDLAYGIVVVILVLSSLGILLNALTGEEQKLTIAQLLLNAAVTLILITFFYSISAIIYDGVVNYGNSLVASVFQRFMNSNVVLDRLQPGGDLTINVVLQTFEFTGVTDALTDGLKGVLNGLYPVVEQSTGAFARNIVHGPGNIIGATLGIGAGVAGVFANGAVSNLLGNKEVFDAIIAWSIFLLNLKIFLNLLEAFVMINMYTAFGPIMMLKGVGKGPGECKDVFKAHAVKCGVFPCTLGCVLLAGVLGDIRMSPSQGLNIDKERTKTVICAYSNTDPRNTQSGIIDKKVIKYSDPQEFRFNHYLAQDIFNATPRNTVNGVPSCESKLVGTFVTLPAPMGIPGTGLIQVQTDKGIEIVDGKPLIADGIMHAVLTIAALILCAKIPGILNEVAEVKELSALRGITGAITAGVKPFFGIGGLGVSSLPLVAKAAGVPFKIPWVHKSWLGGGDPTKPGGGGWYAALGSKLRAGSGNFKSIEGLIGGLKKSNLDELAEKSGQEWLNARAAIERRFTDPNSKLSGVASADQDELRKAMVGQTFSKSYEGAMQATTWFTTALEGSVSVINTFTGALANAARDLEKLVVALSIDVD